LLVVLGLAAVFSAASAAGAKKCMKCIPHAKKDCSTKDMWEEEVCENDNSYCRRMIQNVSGKTSYVLQCGYGSGKGLGDPKEGKDREYYNTANDYVKANVYHCDTDLCNSAVGATLSKLTTVAVLALAWMLH